MTSRPTLIAVACAGFLASGAVTAAPCAGFTDVDDASSFCANVEWLKNRKVTLGCTSTTLYCPGDVVTRLSMSAFMNRLGTALTPVDLALVSAAPAARNLTANPVICISGPYQVLDFPRRAYVSASTDLSAPTGNVDVVATVVVTTNGGATWTLLPGSHQYTSLYTGASPGNHYTLSPFGAADLEVGQTVSFGVQLGRFGGAGDVSAGCSNAVQIANRNRSASPFDPASPAVVGRGRGS
jgi:hypothetical protein